MPKFCTSHTTTKNPTTPYNRAGRQDQRACALQPEKQRKGTDTILLDMFCAVLWVCGVDHCEVGVFVPGQTNRHDGRQEAPLIYLKHHTRRILNGLGRSMTKSCDVENRRTRTSNETHGGESQQPSSAHLSVSAVEQKEINRHHEHGPRHSNRLNQAICRPSCRLPKPCLRPGNW